MVKFTGLLKKVKLQVVKIYSYIIEMVLISLTLQEFMFLNMTWLKEKQ